jgi:predicted small metal-binding protein
MKQMTCAQMGGPTTCNFVVTGNTAEEMVKNAMNHVMQAHPDMAENIKKMAPEDTTKWFADFQKRFDAAPMM